MTAKRIIASIARRFGIVPDVPWVVRKDGYFLLQDGRRTTSNVYEAGIWSEAEANNFRDLPWHTALSRATAIKHFDDTPETPEAEIARLRARLITLEADACRADGEADAPLPQAVATATDNIGNLAHFLDLDRLADKNRPAIVEGVNDTDRWHRNDAMRFYPLLYTPPDLTERFKDYVATHLLADMPAFPQIFRYDRPTLTFGSCFASRIRDYLQARQSTAANVWIPEGLNNTHALLSYFEWALTDDREALREAAFIKTTDGRIINWADGADHEAPQIRAALKGAGGFIFTLGMTEVWRNKETSTVFWRGVPREAYDANLHEAHQSTFAENLDNVTRLVALIRREVGNVPIVFTVSPVTLTATFRGTSAMVADCASKCTLRAVVEELMAIAPADVYYWPSFEMVRWLGSHLEKSTYTLPTKDEAGKILTDSIHIPDWVVAGIIGNFIDAAFHPS